MQLDIVVHDCELVRACRESCVGLLAAESDPLSNPFQGLYQVNSFDLVVMTPYFVVMIILAMYGIHRYVLVYNFFKNRKRIAPPPPEISEWPRVTVQLPIYNERYVIERLVDVVAQFDYPRELLDIQVLDDSTDETQEVARNCVERYQQLGLPISYHSSRQPRGIQGRRFTGRIEGGARRICRHLRC